MFTDSQSLGATVLAKTIVVAKVGLGDLFSDCGYRSVI